jgi:hypothetical protein
MNLLCRRMHKSRHQPHITENPVKKRLKNTLLLKSSGTTTSLPENWLIVYLLPFFQTELIIGLPVTRSAKNQMPTS